ncbi:MAG: hypothetical protein PVS2B3_06450 [Steroidobacteraceae bacterium]
MRILNAIAVCSVFLAGASAQEASPDRATHAVRSPKTVLQAYVSAWNRHDAAAFDALLAPKGIHEDIAAGFRGEGPAQVKDFMREILKAEPDLTWQLTTIIESGPIVAAEWTWTATHTGDSPNGRVVAKRISGRGATVAVIENGRIKRFTDYYDTASYFPQAPSAHQ